MEDTNLQLAEKEIDLQVKKVDKILDRRGDSGQHFDEFFHEEKAKLYGMLQIYWIFGGTGYHKYKQ